MATAATHLNQPEADHTAAGDMCSTKTRQQGEGLRQYYMQHIHDLQLQVRQKSHNLHRLEAQRNDLNSRGTNSKP